MNQLPINKCIVIARKVDSIHWQAAVRGEDISGKGCGIHAEMSLAIDELRAYTRDIEEEACSKQDYAGYWTTCAFTPEGGP